MPLKATFYWFDFGIILAQDSRALVGVQETGVQDRRVQGLRLGTTRSIMIFMNSLVIIAPSDPWCSLEPEIHDTRVRVYP